MNDSKWLAELCSPDPRLSKARIEERNGGLLRELYCWIFNHKDFQYWHHEESVRLLWVSGDPGKGKTMLLCGIIDELAPSTKLHNSMCGTLLSYFFCQATDSRIKTATSVLRGLIYLLADQHRSLMSHMRAKYGHSGKQLFEGPEAWVALSEIFTKMLEDPVVTDAYLIIDALDECLVDLPKLLNLMTKASIAFPRVKWIVSSRNFPAIQLRLSQTAHQIRLDLELNEDLISVAVGTYIEKNVDNIAHFRRYDEPTKLAVKDQLVSKANNTFLWVSLICKDLENIPKWKVLKELEAFPPGLDAVYRQMMNRIRDSRNADLYKQILAIVSIVLRPITLDELSALVETFHGLDDDCMLEEIRNCGSFLTVKARTIYLVHHTAKDFLSGDMSEDIFPSGKLTTHQVIFSRSLRAMSGTLRRDIFQLGRPGVYIFDITKPNPDALSQIRYSCVHWVDHLYECGFDQSAEVQNVDFVEAFLRRAFLYWLEALSLDRSISCGVMAIEKLEKLLMAFPSRPAQLLDFVRDAHNFLLYWQSSIELYPLQVYISALIFSPTNSSIRRLFEQQEIGWVTLRGMIAAQWPVMLHDLEAPTTLIPPNYGEERPPSWARGPFDRGLTAVASVAFSPDGQLVATGSDYGSLRLWDATTGTLRQILRSFGKAVVVIIFLPNNQQLLSRCSKGEITCWDIKTGAQIDTIYHLLRSPRPFSPDGKLLALGFTDGTIQVRDASNGNLIQTMTNGTEITIISLAFAPDNQRIVFGSVDGIARLWHLTKPTLRTTKEKFIGPFKLLVFSPGNKFLVSASVSRKSKLYIWNTNTGVLLRALPIRPFVTEVAFSGDGKRLASSSGDRVQIWDLDNGLLVYELICKRVISLAFSPCGQLLATGSSTGEVQVWDVGSPWIDSFPTTALSFLDNSRIITDAGIVDLDSLAGQPQEPEDVEYELEGWGFSDDDHWLTWKGHNIILLPAPPEKVAVSEREVAIGCPSGRVLILSFSGDPSKYFTNGSHEVTDEG
ncbi:hypothetical protein BGZ63DRAFT_446476 [Mariannaea sp. PMI_226]|nr:hypothetical protein BGZ63DRAFT_446476 [Mariannaea sp. PMI_226]